LGKAFRFVEIARCGLASLIRGSRAVDCLKGFENAGEIIGIGRGVV